MEHRHQKQTGEKGTATDLKHRSCKLDHHFKPDVSGTDTIDHKNQHGSKTDIDTKNKPIPIREQNTVHGRRGRSTLISTTKQSVRMACAGRSLLNLYYDTQGMPIDNLHYTYTYPNGIWWAGCNHYAGNPPVGRASARPTGRPGALHRLAVLARFRALPTRCGSPLFVRRTHIAFPRPRRPKGLPHKVATPGHSVPTAPLGLSPSALAQKAAQLCDEEESGLRPGTRRIIGLLFTRLRRDRASPLKWLTPPTPLLRRGGGPREGAAPSSHAPKILSSQTPPKVGVPLHLLREFPQVRR